jgi:hypothetical protein
MFTLAVIIMLLKLKSLDTVSNTQRFINVKYRKMAIYIHKDMEE